jgi:hypothetical protein
MKGSKRDARRKVAGGFMCGLEFGEPWAQCTKRKPNERIGGRCKFWRGWYCYFDKDMFSEGGGI